MYEVEETENGYLVKMPRHHFVLTGHELLLLKDNILDAILQSARMKE